METWTQRRGATGPLDAVGALNAADAREAEDQAGRVLIVDDDAAVRPVCLVNLEDERLHPREPGNGPEGPCDLRGLASFVARELLAVRASSSELIATVANQALANPK